MSLKIGGAEKSLVNIMNLLDYSQWQVDLLLFQNSGAFLDQVPKTVHIIHDIRPINILFQDFSTTLRTEKNHLTSAVFLAFRRYFYTFFTTVKYRQFDRIRINRWIRCYRRLIPDLRQKYDVAVAYAGGETLYYMVDKVKADRKIAYYHSDYSKIDIDSGLEEKFLRQVDAIVTISDTCRNSLVKLFPGQQEKIHVFPNLTSPDMIRSMAEAYFPKEFSSAGEKAVIVSVSRLHPIKGIDIAVEAAAQLKGRGRKLIWFIVGEGGERKALESQIKKRNLQYEFFLLGNRVNPYPYIKNADIFVQPSRFEGKSVVLDEAKILNKAIVVTDYHSVADQIENMVTGIVTPINASGIADGVDLLLRDNELKNKLTENLAKIDFSVQGQVRDFQSFIEGI